MLSLERLEDNLFRGQNHDIGTKYVFGGQILAQALAAAQNTIESSRIAHSLHAYFLRAGNIQQPIIYNVERTRDGKSFSLRRVTAIQHGQVIFFCTASFQECEDGAEHQAKMPAVRPPEDIAPIQSLPPLPTQMHSWLNLSEQFEFRRARPSNELDSQQHPPSQHLWLRLNAPLGDSIALHQVLLTYASDFQLLDTAAFPHGINYHTPQVQMASLDHALWFHRPFRIDDWLLYALESPSAQGARGLAQGQFFTQNGVLVANTAQEGLMRTINHAAPPKD
ncbi:acyl-CoA thioesterase II [Xylella taiwanensis]|uniref:Acyl-CoA thioesterase 2 n=1 Tax=Xylella taiwanensis TaxID=1444770 RepID=Z9JFA9_9GAMM|nr:acyl-CoA thioesterase II [Xylella taiwanensis]AXI82810.1 palmitoyl-CoA hydrolase [Xylella taiwanensis]EWS77050.1 acyl-CoA thioesterase [Xylella taiwanensis]MCD8455823.1 acyl-CoA thioesterase II [Xylella taiwanensis]MCD8458228.1 acyl-CoA thioesterase II [Xylella taiwanensis]MCD8460364.1 acyl-CoA thioesterase II [Xylella taiwanensis]